MLSISKLSAALFLGGTYGMIPVVSEMVFSEPQYHRGGRIESWEKDNGCNIRAWVRAEDLIPSAVLNGDLRIRVNPSCAEQIVSVALQLRLDEYAEVKFPRTGAVMPTAPICGNTTCEDPWRPRRDPRGSESEMDRYIHIEALSDPELWDIQAEERTAWHSTVTLHEGPFEYARPLVIPFIVAMPPVQFPPGYESYSAFYNDAQANVTHSKHVYRYTALVTFSDGRLTKVPAGYTTFHPTPSVSSQPRSSTNVTFSYNERRHDYMGACSSFWSPEDRAEVHTARIDLERGSNYHQGDVLAGNITFYDNTSFTGVVRAYVIQEQNRKWAQSRAQASGSDAFSPGSPDEYNPGFQPISASSCRYGYIFGTEDACLFEDRDFHRRINSSSPQLVGFRIKIEQDVVPNFQMHYTDVETFLQVSIDIPYPLDVRTCLDPSQRDAPPASDADLVEEQMWDEYTPIGQSVEDQLATYQLTARIPITILSDRKLSVNTPSEPPRHYLDPEGAPSPILLAEAPSSIAEVVFPMSHPTISAKSVEDTARRILTAPMRFAGLQNFSAQCADDYYAGSFAGVLWKKKYVAGIRNYSPGPNVEGSEEAQGLKEFNSWLADNSKSMPRMPVQEVFAVPV